MFSRRTDSSDTPIKQTPSAAPVAHVVTAPPQSDAVRPSPAAPAKPTKIETPYRGESVISPDLTIEGNVQSKGSIRLEGTIQGELNCNSVIVERTGMVTGGIEAEDVSVHGKVAGTIRGKSVMLYSTAHVEGDVFHQGIGIEMGTHYDGRLKWSDGATSRTPPASPTNDVQVGSEASREAALVPTPGTNTQ